MKTTAEKEHAGTYSPLFNATLFNELEKMGKEMDHLAVKDVTTVKAPGGRGVKATSFNGFASVPGAKNYCGQAACASIIKAWGHHGGKSDEALAAEIYKRFPPDIFGGACGTSPGRAAEILSAYGFKVEYAQVGLWMPGGFLNPLNQIAWQNHRSHIEDQWVKAGFPVVALVDAGAINGPWFQPHWVPFAAVTDTEATIGDSLGSSKYIDQTMNIDRFHEAWEVRFLPNLNFVSLLPKPI